MTIMPVSHPPPAAHRSTVRLAVGTYLMVIGSQKGGGATCPGNDEAPAEHLTSGSDYRTPPMSQPSSSLIIHDRSTRRTRIRSGRSVAVMTESATELPPDIVPFGDPQ